MRAVEERLLVLRNTVEHDGRMLVNGAIAPRMAARRGTLRLRLLNASTQEYVRLGFEHLAMHLIATDAGLIERPVELAELLLSPGERAEILVVLDGRDEQRLMRLPYARAGGAAREEPEPLLTVDAADAPRPTPLPGHLRSVPALDVGGAVRRRVTFGVARTGEYLINGRAFDHDRVEYRPRTGTTEVWELVNEHTSDHSFHLHSWPIQVLDRNGRPEPFRAWRDVVNLRGGDVVRVAIAFRHFRGRTVFHCHSAEHEDGGMMAVIDVLGGSQRHPTTEEPHHAHH
jgi:FtsP/CotA-like multicopper oxidase with cupredoxin domain